MSISQTDMATPKSILWIILFTLLFCNLSALFALDPEKSIAQYGHSLWLPMNGLPANKVNVSLQSHDGYLWFGTSAGLFRFDGVSFDSIRTEPSQKPDGSITALARSRDNGLWVGTKWTGFRHLKDGQVRRHALLEGFFNTQINALIESADHRPLIGTSIGLYRLDSTMYTPLMLEPNYVTALAIDNSGRIWAGTHEGVFILDAAGQQILKQIKQHDGLPHNNITCLHFDRQSIMWIGTANGLARVMNDKTVKTYAQGERINVVYKDKDNNLWTGTRSGLNRLSSGDTWSRFTKNDGLTDNNVLSITEDHENNLWVCTSDGLNQFKNINLTTYTTYDGLYNNFISSIVESPDNSLYFCSSQSASITKFGKDKSVFNEIPVGPVYVARDSSIWTGQTGALSKLKNGIIRQYSTRDGLPDKWISAITEDDRSLIIYFDHVGIRRFVEGRLEPYLMADGKPYPNREYMTCFHYAKDGALWIGMADSLVRIRNGVSRHFTTRDGLANNWVSSIYEDKDSTLWISSPQGGLTRYRNGEFIAFSYKDGLFTNEIYCVLGDDQGGLWLSSPVGIGHVEKKELAEFAAGHTDSLHCKVYGVQEGMKTKACFGDWQPSGWKAHDGSLWFATSKGAVKIVPGTFKSNQTPPPVHIESIRSDEIRSYRESNTTFAAGTQKLEFHYTALSFKEPQNVRFKYKIEGYDKNWVNAGTRRSAFYTNLPPGDYAFRVIACNNDGVWNTQGAAINFVLQPHFYQTPGFYILIFFLVAGAIYAIFRWRIHRHLEQERILNERIKEATAHIKTLSGLLPICANCKKIRHDDGYWEQLEGYIQTRSELQFSHGICPDCMQKLYPDYTDEESE
ncbi:MAG: two-component regulator propeller domain-containing protein [candidate division KSB1 bacterium]|nr:two-component regulator propeller domain-containing protein [candidate division KSB1 bacterium]